MTFLISLTMMIGLATAGDYDDLRDGRYWSSTPTVKRCSGSKVSKETMIKAVNFWKS